MELQKINFDKWLFRPSQLGDLCTAPKSGTGLSETTKTALKQIFTEATTGRRKDIKSKFLQKGNECEDDAITLVCDVLNDFYIKNTERLENDFLSGEPDLIKFDGENAISGIDTKCSWDCFTLPYADEKLDKAYKWQNTGYMMLTGADSWATVFCLVSAPNMMILDEIRIKQWVNNIRMDEMSEEFMELEAKVHLSMTFDDIPKEQRICFFPMERNEADIDLIKNSVPVWREYLTSLYKLRTYAK